MRGSLDHVYVNYTVTQLDRLNNETAAHQDFVNATGAVLFLPGQRSEVCVPVLMCPYVSPSEFIQGVIVHSHSVGKSKCDVPVIRCICTLSY